MRLRKLTVRNFRAIGELEISFDPQLTVLIGDNASGKTCILDAIAKGLAPIANRVLGSATRVLDSQDIRRINGRQELYAVVQLETLNGEVWDRGVTRDVTETTRHEADEAFSRVRYRRLFNVVDPAIAARGEGQNEPSLPVIAYYGTDRSVVPQVSRVRRVFEERRNKAVPPWQAAYRGALNPTVNFDQLLWWFEAMEAEELRRQRDEDPNWVHPQLEEVRKVVESVIPGARNVRVNAKGHLEVDLREQDGHDEALALNELSGGYRTLLALVADLARRMAQINPAQGTASEAIVLIDEVDLHLHPRWQQSVLDSFRAAFPNAQFIVSTHSEQIISAVEPHHVIRLDRAPQGVVLSRPQSTYGATPDRISEDVMGLPHLRKKDVQDKLDLYWGLIKAGQGESERARSVRDELDEWFRGQDPEMIRADAEIARRAMIRKLRSEAKG